MSDAKLEKTNIYISTLQSELQFVVRGEVIKFEGFLKVYLESSDEDEESDLFESGSLFDQDDSSDEY